MNLRIKLRENSGLSILEVLLCVGILSIFIVMSLIFSSSINRNSQLNRTSATRNRLLLGVQNVAGMPAALRNSVRAALADGVTPVNKDLNNCVAGTQVNSCKNNLDYSLTLFSPTVSTDSSGNPLGLLPITAPRGGTTPSRFDSFGVPCVQNSPDCLFIVYTSFQAQCPPNVLPATPPPTSDPSYLNLLKPMNTCTIADVITVSFSVEVDPAAAAANPSFLSLTTPVLGSVTTSVKLIFGNDPR